MTTLDRTLQSFTGVVAIDGPSGTGKSTVARQLATRLGARYLDTGAMYRAITVAVLRSEVALQDPAAITAVAERVHLEISTDPLRSHVLLDGVDASEQIRSSEVTAAVSAVSAVAGVRTLLVAAQRELIGAGGIVVEGRDIASVVWPAARPKVYLTASEQVRASRRAGELGAGADVAAVAADLARRDRFDSGRAVSPLTQVDGATELDTSDLNIDEVVSILVDLTLNG